MAIGLRRLEQPLVPRQYFKEKPTSIPRLLILLEANADMAELVDALDLGSSVLVT